jgi:hypothetical protein
MASSIPSGAQGNPEPEPQWSEGLDDEDLDALRQAHQDATKIILESPIRLGYYSLLCLIMDRMIGIFERPLVCVL